MKRPGLQSKSKRTSVRLREKVKKKVRDHNRKQRKFDRENAKTKKQHVPNSAPFKDEILMEAIKFQEVKRAKVAERKERRKIKKGKAKAETIASLMKDVQSAQSTYNKKQATKDAVKAEAYEHDKKKAAWFRRELKYVTSNADVILEVLDARDPIGCRSEQLESQAFAAGKRVVLVLNKVDLVPKPIVKGWLEVLRKQLPTVAFKASTQKQRTNLGRGQSASGATAYGADQLTKLLGAFAKTKGMKTGVTAAVVGFPNVGKSSIINTLARSRVCNVSATAGSTKDTQEVSIDKAVKLLDSPGVLFGGSAEKQALRGALSASALADPVEGALALLNRCDKVALALHYSTNHTDNGRSFLAQLAQKRGLVKKGGIPDCEKSARQILQDCQRGRFSFYTKPPKTATAEEMTVPEFLDAKLVTTMSEEFKLDGLDDWMETSDISAPTSGKGIGLSNDGFGELEDSEDEEEEEGQSDEENEEMEEDDKMEEDVAVDFPEKKSVKFGGVSDKKVPTDLRQRQKADKKILKRKDKFETKLSESVEKALKLM